MTFVLIDKNYISCILWLLLFAKLQYSECSLLSRFKNRYEYIPQEKVINTFTEDLYDFEFTNNKLRSTIKEFYVTYTTLSLREKDFLYKTSSSIIKKNITNKDLQDDINMYKKLQNHWYQRLLLNSFKTRPITYITSTGDTFSLNSKKTWATNFSTKTVTANTLQNVSSSTIINRNQKQRFPSAIRTSTEPRSFFRQRPQITVATNIILLKPKNITMQTNTTLPKFIKHLLKASTVSSCYRCGLNESKIPMPHCYNTFEGDNQIFSQRRYKFKIKCIYSTEISQIKNKYYGPWYRGGCFKRFLDIGTEYNERGCRTRNPTRGKSFASKRLAKLEKVLENVEDGCVSSPHASLTPFSRAISIYTHYHVCVCSKKYCNSSNMLISPLYYIKLVIFVNTIINYVVPLI